MVEGVGDRLGHGRLAGQGAPMRDELRMQGLQDRSRLGLPHGAPLGSRAAADACLDGIDLGQPLDHLHREG